MAQADVMDIFSVVPTEQINPETINIDVCSTRVVLEMINDQDAGVPAAVRQAIPQIAEVVDKVVAAFECGGRLFYIGAGTSGRLGVLDASECPPTFSVEPELVQGIIAGGDLALRNAIENAEDDGVAGTQAIREAGVKAGDVVVGLSASGGAAYVVEAIKTAQGLGAYTAALTCYEQSSLAHAADVAMVVDVGPEALTGSTRMKAGTAQKLVLNMITTAAMIGWGKTYRNLMVDVKPTNAKLRDRAGRLVAAISGVSKTEAHEYLTQSQGMVKPAIVMAKMGVGFQEAQQRLMQNGGRLRSVLEQV